MTDALAMIQVAYLASSLFLDYKSDMIILVVNTLTTDLKSDNFLVGERSMPATVCNSSEACVMTSQLAFQLHPLSASLS